MYRNSLLFPLVSCLTLASCASVQPTTQELATEDYGPPIEQADAERLAKELVSTVLKDPCSAIYQCDAPQKGWKNDTIFEKYQKHYGYVMRRTVNARNSFGAYDGAKPHDFVFNMARLSQRMGRKTWAVIKATCEKSNSGGTYARRH